MPNKAFLKKKSLLDRFKDAHGGHTGYIQSARAKHTWNNPIMRNKRTKSLNGWINSFQGRQHVRKLSRFNALSNESYGELTPDVQAWLDRLEDTLVGMYHLDADNVRSYFDARMPEVLALYYSDELSEVKAIKLAYAGYLSWTEKDEKLSYEKGHKDSKGGDAPWVIRSHEDNRVLASFANKGDAEEHMKRMKQYSKSESNTPDKLYIVQGTDSFTNFTDDYTQDELHRLKSSTWTDEDYRKMAGLLFGNDYEETDSLWNDIYNSTEIGTKKELLDMNYPEHLFESKKHEGFVGEWQSKIMQGLEAIKDKYGFDIESDEIADPRHGVATVYDIIARNNELAQSLVHVGPEYFHTYTDTDFDYSKTFAREDYTATEAISKITKVIKDFYSQNPTMVRSESNTSRGIPEKTLQTVMANLVCLGKPGKAMQNYSASRRREIFDELEKRGWLEPGSIIPSSKGKELAKDWVELCQESKKSETAGNEGINTDDVKSIIRDLGLEIINTWYDGDRSRTVYDVRNRGDEYGEVACVWVESPYEARIWLRDANPCINRFVEGITDAVDLRTELARILGIATDESIEEAATLTGYRGDVLSELDVSWHYGMDGASRLYDKYARFIRDSYNKGETPAETAHMIARADGNIYAVESRTTESTTNATVKAFKEIADSLGISERANVYTDGNKVGFSLKLDIPDLESYTWEYDPRGKIIDNLSEHGARKRVDTLDDAVSWLTDDIEDLLALEKESKMNKAEGFSLEQVDTIRVPQWLWIAYVNDDPSGLEDDENDMLAEFREKYRDYHLDDRGEEAYFSSSNDFDSLGGNVYDVDVYRKLESHGKYESMRELKDFPSGKDYKFTFVFILPKVMRIASDTAKEMGIDYEQDGDTLTIWTKTPTFASRFASAVFANATLAGIPASDIPRKGLILALAIKNNAGYENDKEAIDAAGTQYGVSVEPTRTFDGIFVKGELDDVVDFLEAIKE